MAIKKRNAIPIAWLTTAHNPRSDLSDPVGWSRHALVGVSDDTSIRTLRYTQAACGLQPAHGWDYDLFIERECMNCARALIRDGICPDDVRKRFDAQVKLLASFRAETVYYGDKRD